MNFNKMMQGREKEGMIHPLGKFVLVFGVSCELALFLAKLHTSHKILIFCELCTLRTVCKRQPNGRDWQAIASLKKNIPH